MLGSESDFFYSNNEELDIKKNLMIEFLKNHKTSDEVVGIYKDAFDYFIKNPENFDGATILKDVKVVPNLDIFAMLHDYLYIYLNVSVNWKYKFIADKIYAEEMERCGLPWEVTWVRFSLLLLTHLLFTPYEYLRGKRMNNIQKFYFIKLYSKFN